MTYGQMIAEVLRLTFASGGAIVGEGAEAVERMRNDHRYVDYIDKIPGAFNRALADLEAKKMIPWKARQLALAEGQGRGGAKAYKLAEIAPDLYEIEKVGAWNAGRGTRELLLVEDYEYDSEELIIYGGAYADAFVLQYTPRLERMTAATDAEAQISLPEALASAIPYFIKGDLYEAEEPGEAAKARNIYEQMVGAYLPPQHQVQGRVVRVYDF